MKVCDNCKFERGCIYMEADLDVTVCCHKEERTTYKACENCTLKNTSCDHKAYLTTTVDKCAHKITPINGRKEFEKPTVFCANCVSQNMCNDVQLARGACKEYKQVETHIYCRDCTQNNLCSAAQKIKLNPSNNCLSYQQKRKSICKESITIRDDLMLFVGTMETVLKENDYKGNWKDEFIQYLYHKFTEEVLKVTKLAELTFLDICEQDYMEKDTIKIKAKFEKELINVANMCMMIWSKL